MIQHKTQHFLHKLSDIFHYCFFKGKVAYTLSGLSVIFTILDLMIFAHAMTNLKAECCASHQTSGSK